MDRIQKNKVNFLSAIDGKISIKNNYNPSSVYTNHYLKIKSNNNNCPTIKDSTHKKSFKIESIINSLALKELMSRTIMAQKRIEYA